MGSTTSKNIADRIANNKVPGIENISQEYVNDFKQAATKLQADFPLIDTVNSINTSKDMSSNEFAYILAEALVFNDRYMNDYEEASSIVKGQSAKGFLAGDGTMKNTILVHELAHNFDEKFSTFISGRAPSGEGITTPITNQYFANIYSKAAEKDVSIGDTVIMPNPDSNAKFIDIDGVKYSVNDMHDKVSRLVVPLAIKNIQANYKDLGFKTTPTEAQIVQNLSGYVYRHHFKGEQYEQELFAESFSNYYSYGSKSNVLAQEVMRLTKQVYGSVSRRKDNGYLGFLKRLTNAMIGSK